MALVTSTEMFKKAYTGGYAIGAFNVNNMEIIQGITEAAIEKRAPLILQVSKGARAYAKHVYLMKLIEAAIADAEQTAGFDLPICVHLDHGDTFELCKSCIDGGFTSVMIDGSSKSFEDNIALTKQVVEYAHDPRRRRRGRAGHAGRRRGRGQGLGRGFFLHPPRRGRGVRLPHGRRLAGHRHRHQPRRVQVHHAALDCNADGILVPPPLRFDILDEVAKRLPGFPIVLHGSSSVPQEFVKIINENGGKMPDAVGIPRGTAAPGGARRGLQDQHRLRPAPGHDRLHPQVLRGASGSLRSPSVPQARPRGHQGHGRPQAGRRARLRRQGLIP